MFALFFYKSNIIIYIFQIYLYDVGTHSGLDAHLDLVRSLFGFLIVEFEEFNTIFNYLYIFSSILDNFKIFYIF